MISGRPIQPFQNRISAKNILRTRNKQCTLISIESPFVPLANPGHKEHDPMSATPLRIVEGSSMDKTKALSAALSQIERQFGKGSVMKLGKNDRSMDIETISSGSLGLDIALGVGGLPRGRVVEIYGPESW